MKKQLLFIFSICFYFSYSQERKIFFGKILDDLGELPSVHVINKNTNQATASNNNGEFRVFAQPKDTIQFSFVGYKTQTLVLQSSDFSINEKQIHLKKEVIELDEIELKKHNLTGNLISDSKQTPKNIGIAKSKGALDFSMIDFNKKVTLPDDEVEDSKYPDMLKVTDPTQKIQGITLLSLLIFKRKKSKRLKQRINREKKRDELPRKIISLIGKTNFTREFKIPKDKVYHFLEYCGYEKLNELSNNKRVFELIELLSEKSKLYLKIIK